MQYTILFDERAANELAEIVAQQINFSDLAIEKFETAFNWVMDTLQTDQADYALFTGEIRKAPVPDFPWLIYYSRNKEQKQVFIHAILHKKRGPDFLSKRMEM